MDSVALSDDQTNALLIAMARLENEFCNILLAHTTPIQIDSVVNPAAAHDNPNNIGKGSSTYISNYRSTSSIHELNFVSFEVVDSAA